MTKHESMQNQLDSGLNHQVDSDLNHQSSHETKRRKEDCRVKPVNSCEHSIATRGHSFFQQCKGNSVHYEKSLKTGVQG